MLSAFFVFSIGWCPYTFFKHKFEKLAMLFDGSKSMLQQNNRSLENHWKEQQIYICISYDDDESNHKS